MFNTKHFFIFTKLKVSVLTKFLLAQWKAFSMSILCVIVSHGNPNPKTLLIKC